LTLATNLLAYKWYNPAVFPWASILRNLTRRSKPWQPTSRRL
jgi:hypothetical protein